MKGGAYPIAALPLGFVFSIIIGGLLVFAGFNTIASKVASFFVGMSLLVVLWMAMGLISKALVAAALGLMIGLSVSLCCLEVFHGLNVAGSLIMLAFCDITSCLLAPCRFSMRYGDGAFVFIMRM